MSAGSASDASLSNGIAAIGKQAESHTQASICVFAGNSLQMVGLLT